MEKLIYDYASTKFALEIKQLMENEDSSSPFFGIILIDKLGNLKEELEIEMCEITELTEILSKNEIHNILLNVHLKYYNLFINKE